MAFNRETITGPTRGDYKGSPTISIPTAKGYPFTFGIEKAKAVLAHAGAIEKFVEDCEQRKLS